MEGAGVGLGEDQLTGIRAIAAETGRRQKQQSLRDQLLLDQETESLAFDRERRPLEIAAAKRKALADRIGIAKATGVADTVAPQVPLRWSPQDEQINAAASEGQSDRDANRKYREAMTLRAMLMPGGSHSGTKPANWTVDRTMGIATRTTEDGGLEELDMQTGKVRRVDGSAPAPQAPSAQPPQPAAPAWDGRFPDGEPNWYNPADWKRRLLNDPMDFADPSGNSDADPTPQDIDAWKATLSRPGTPEYQSSIAKLRSWQKGIDSSGKAHPKVKQWAATIRQSMLTAAPTGN